MYVHGTSRTVTAVPTHRQQWQYITWVSRADCYHQRVPLRLLPRVLLLVTPSIHLIAWLRWPTVSELCRFFENYLRIIGSFLRNNWEKKIEFGNRIIGKKKRIMCRPLQGVPIPLYTYHIALLREVSVIEALWSHPLDWQFHPLPMALFLPVVVPLKHILRQTEIWDLDQEMCIDPNRARGADITKYGCT